MRIGPKMKLVAQIVANNPGCSKYLPAERVGPHGSLQFGYRTVDRAIGAGLVRAERGNNGRYQLFAVERPMTTIQRDGATYLVPAL